MEKLTTELFKLNMYSNKPMSMCYSGTFLPLYTSHMSFLDLKSIFNFPKRLSKPGSTYQTDSCRALISDLMHTGISHI